MRILIFGASGMVGQGVLRELLLDPGVSRVVSVVRTASGAIEPKLEEIVLADLAAIETIADRLAGFDAAIFAIGVSAVGLSEAEYRRLNHDLVLRVAETLARRDADPTFIYVSASGADPTGQSRLMWARVRGETETALQRLPFKAVYLFRPAAIQPLHGIRSRTAAYRWLYAATAPILPLLLRLFPNGVTTTERIGRAMLAVIRNGYPQPVLATRDINRASEPKG